MKIRTKILLYISAIIIPIIGVAFAFVYIIFAEYREDEFQQQQLKKIKTSIKLLEKFKEESAEISLLLDKQDINDFYNEKLHIFDGQKKIIFESLDDLEIHQKEQILQDLSPTLPWIETHEEGYDLIGVYINHKENGFYGVSKAYDYYGKTKLDFLRWVLVLTFTGIVFLILAVAIYIAKSISKPIIALESKIMNYNLNSESFFPIEIPTKTTELIHLTNRFNDLLESTKEAFKFQKHSTNHISHQLKTPISILVNELEILENQTKELDTKEKIEEIKIKTRNLGEIINVLLMIAKIDSGQTLVTAPERIDELIFDCISELNRLYPNFLFEVRYSPENMNERQLIFPINKMLLKQAIVNLLTNCIYYSSKGSARIELVSTNLGMSISFSNEGKTLTNEEETFLFKHFFRGENSQGIQGQGLGLILTQKIVKLHHSTISYTHRENENRFTVSLLR